MGMVTLRSGSALRLTVTVTALPPSVAVYVAAPNCAVTWGWSLSVRFTVAVLCVPGLTSSGSVPKLRVTLSPSSSTLSSTAVTVKVAEVSPLSMVTDVADRE